MQNTTTLDPLRKREPSDFKIGRHIGEGSYSTVVLATEKATGQIFALKILDKRHIVKHNKVKYVSIEKQVLNRLDHPLVVRLYYTFQDQASLYFALEYAPGGDLLKLMRRCGGRLSMRQTQFFAAELACALEYMHQNQVLHRDLKPENILIANDFHIRVTDFGTAKDLRNISSGNGDTNASQSRNSFVGTAEYCSPELLNDRVATAASDLWAYGVILFHMATGKLPFQGGSEYMTFQAILSGSYNWPLWLNYDDDINSHMLQDLKDLVGKILLVDPDKRISHDGNYTTLKAHGFFRHIDWTVVHDGKLTPPEFEFPHYDSEDSSEDEIALPIDLPLSTDGEDISSTHFSCAEEAFKTDPDTAAIKTTTSRQNYIHQTQVKTATSSSSFHHAGDDIITNDRSPKTIGLLHSGHLIPPLAEGEEIVLSSVVGLLSNRFPLFTKNRHLVLTSKRILLIASDKSFKELLFDGLVVSATSSSRVLRLTGAVRCEHKAIRNRVWTIRMKCARELADWQAIIRQQLGIHNKTV